MRRVLATVVFAALALWSTAAGAADFEWQGRIAAGKTIEVKGVNGAIVALAGAGDEVRVTAVKHGHRSDPESVEVRKLEHEGGITICAVYPAPDGRPNECVPGEGGHMSTRDNDVVVDFTVAVPAGVRFVGRTVNGRVEARDLSGEAEAHTVNGGIELDTAGFGRAETVNGSIHARFGRADWTGSLDLTTVNGSVTVELPASAGARVEASTVNGSIETDFPLTVEGQLSRRHVSGTIGGGGGDLRLKTVNGSIHLLKR
jgi:Toastrack DUF4097